MVHRHSLYTCHWRYLALWILLCRVVLHSGVGVDGLLLLRLWIPLLGLHHFDHYVRRNYSSLYVLSALQLVLPLVVALLWQRWIDGDLRLFVLDCLLQAARGQQSRNLRAVFRLHGSRLIGTFHHDGIRWCHYFALVQQDNLFVHQD